MYISAPYIKTYAKSKIHFVILSLKHKLFTWMQFNNQKTSFTKSSGKQKRLTYSNWIKNFVKNRRKETIFVVVSCEHQKVFFDSIVDDLI